MISPFGCNAPIGGHPDELRITRKGERVVAILQHPATDFTNPKILPGKEELGRIEITEDTKFCELIQPRGVSYPGGKHHNIHELFDTLERTVDNPDMGDDELVEFFLKTWCADYAASIPFEEDEPRNDLLRSVLRRVKGMGDAAADGD